VVCPPADGHPSKYEQGPAYSNFIDRDQRATTKPNRQVDLLYASANAHVYNYSLNVHVKTELH